MGDFMIGAGWIARKPKPWREALLGRAEQVEAALQPDPLLGPVSDAEVNVMIGLDVDAGGTRPSFRLRRFGPQPDVSPLATHDVGLGVPVTYFGELGEVERGVALAATFDAMLAAYYRWRQWGASPEVPLTESEQEWVQENGPFVVPTWAHRMVLPRPKHGDNELVRRLLLEVPIGGRADHLIEAADAATTTRQVQAILGGWCTLIAAMRGDRCWDAACEATSWPMTEGVFHDLRSWALLAEPHVDAGSLGDVLREMRDEEDVGEAGSVTHELLATAEQHELDPDDFADPWDPGLSADVCAVQGPTAP